VDLGRGKIVSNLKQVAVIVSEGIGPEVMAGSRRVFDFRRTGKVVPTPFTRQVIGITA
jgi:isocitrate/isopropylmalate dehydrogenase